MKAGESGVFTIRLRPTAQGPVSQRLKVSESEVVSNELVFEGFVTAPDIHVLSGATIDFGKQRKNRTSKPLTATISNTGDAALKIESCIVGPAPIYSIPQSDCAVQVEFNQKTSIRVYFRPAALAAC